MLLYHRCMREAEAVFLICTHMELGVLRAKVEHLTSRAVPDIHFPLGWL